MSDLKSEIEKMEKLKSLEDNAPAPAPKKKRSIAEISAELAKAFDVWRVFPRVFITVYIGNLGLRKACKPINKAKNN